VAETYAVLLVDDQELIRDGINRIVSSESDLDVVAQAADGRAALDVLQTTTVDVVVMDIRMRGMDGIEATRRIRDQGGPPVKMWLWGPKPYEHCGICRQHNEPAFSGLFDELLEAFH